MITNLNFPFVSFPKLTIPEDSANIAGSLGFLASNKSATLGSPPVISLVLVIACGILAIISPASTLSPSDSVIIAPSGKLYSTLPLLFVSL